jgi:molybdenum cofactor synthesis domain-containing protein
MSRSVEVVSVNVSREKGTVKVPVPEVAVEATGIVGDAHAGTWHRQVSLLDEEIAGRFSREIGRTIGAGEFGENITIRGVEAGGARVLDRFRFNEVELEVTQIGKQCHGRGCSIFQQLGKCVMPEEGIFCRVLQGGTIRPGDRGEHRTKVFRFLIITLSDRAAAGEYTDRSGPRIRGLLEEYLAGKSWQAEIETVLASDDAGPLGEQLIAATQAGVDVVFTSGGTGIGPRDTAPETVSGVCEKIIPGIMEHIRVKYGAENPNALLSRSIAGVAGQTLIYALPGGMRAVEEYAREIFKTLEHAIYMGHGLDVHGGKCERVGGAQ